MKWSTVMGSEVQWSEVTWTHLKRDDKMSEICRKWKTGIEVKWSEVKWKNLKRDDKKPESGRKWKMGSEVKWNEVKRSEVKWSEVKWIEVKWSEVKWSEVKWSEVKWSKVKLRSLVECMYYHGLTVMQFVYGLLYSMTLICDNSVTTQNLWFFREKGLKILKCYNFLWVQRRHNCSPSASSTNSFMTLYLLKVICTRLFPYK